MRRPEGWRVAAYRQVPRAPGEVSLAMLPPSLPGFTARPSASAAAIAAHQASLAAAEQAFSDRAQRVGLSAAFREYGREDAMNMYEGAGFAIGLDAITAGFPEGAPTSPVNWSTERASSPLRAISASRSARSAPTARSPRASPASFPFFTIWRRDRPDPPWRYIAE